MGPIIMMPGHATPLGVDRRSDVRRDLVRVDVLTDAAGIMGERGRL